MLSFILQGMGLGFGAGTAFGVLHNLLLNVTLTQGWRYGLLVVLTPLLTDAPIILLMLFILDQLPAGFEHAIPIIGGLFVLWLAWGAWQQYRNPPNINADDMKPTHLSVKIILNGMLVNFLNPAPYIFWGAVGGAILKEAFAQSVLHGAGVLLGFYGTFLGIMAAFVVVFDRMRRLDPRVTRAVSLVSVIVMSVLGAGLIVQGLRGFGIL